ncbi:TetR/AcrR family transcriptional regulator [Nocardia thailandica]|uniref:TetR/AcrR family transcriptional regulator n=1 Tax=Nocardia thailandica TaxID=257275 RepID=UPI0005BD6BC1|nr:TetR/AcrR family transcriptional regulator [Nocardia thailandica]
MSVDAERPPPLGRRERNKQHLRERIYVAAIALFTNKGYEDVTVDDIVERAEVARGTFFNHYRRKDDLIAEWAERRRQKLVERLTIPLALDAVDAPSLLYLCIGILAQVNEEERALSETMLTAWVKAGKPLTEAPHTASVFAEIVRAGQRHGQFDPHIDADRVGNVLRDAYLGALYRWSGQISRDGDLGRDLRDVLQILLHGIMARR